MKKATKVLLGLALAAFLLPSCSKDNCPAYRGHSTSQHKAKKKSSWHSALPADQQVVQAKGVHS